MGSPPCRPSAGGAGWLGILDGDACREDSRAGTRSLVNQGVVSPALETGSSHLTESAWLRRRCADERSAMEHWYAVHTKARDETIAAENLHRQGFHTFLPRVKAARRRRVHWHEVIEHLFPGYLFIRLDLLIQGSSPIRSTRGALGLVRFGGDPAVVPAELVEQLVATSDEAGVVRQEHLFQAGDRVGILAGPFIGVPATILIETGAERVQILLELLGRTNQVLVSRHQLGPVS